MAFARKEWLRGAGATATGMARRRGFWARGGEWGTGAVECQLWCRSQRASVDYVLMAVKSFGGFVAVLDGPLCRLWSAQSQTFAVLRRHNQKRGCSAGGRERGEDQRQGPSEFCKASVC